MHDDRITLRTSAMRPGNSLAGVLFAVATMILGVLPARAGFQAGAGVAEITPPAGTPSAGYGNRRGRGMEGVHDPLLATALVLDNGTKRLAFCGVDHLGMTGDMIEEIMQGVHADPAMAACEVYVGSSHTHAGGGGFLNFPGMGFILAGKYNPEARKIYIDGAIKAILAAGKDLQPAKIGIGYNHAPLNGYRGDWPIGIQPVDDVAVIKIEKAAGGPLGVLFNFAAHPTVLGGDNMQFSADFIGYARNQLAASLGGGQAVYFNGAQADVSPHPPSAPGGGFNRCEAMGKALAEIVKQTWDGIKTSDAISIATLKAPYMQEAKANSAGMKITSEARATEINAIVFDGKQAFVTIPGELSCIYDRDLKRYAGWLGYEHLSFLGLTNDAHGYIIIPEAWRHRTYESTVSFGGEMYGEFVKSKVEALLHVLEPPGSLNEKQRNAPSILSETGK